MVFKGCRGTITEFCRGSFTAGYADRCRSWTDLSARRILRSSGRSETMPLGGAFMQATNSTQAPGTTTERVRMEPSAKRLRTYLGGVCVADTLQPMLVWEIPFYPAYYFPVADVRLDLLLPDGGVRQDPVRGDGRTFTVRAGGREAAGAALRYEDSPVPELRDLVR